MDDNEEYIESYSPEHIYAEAESLTSDLPHSSNNDTHINGTPAPQEVIYVDPEGNVIKPERVVIVKSGNNYRQFMGNIEKMSFFYVSTSNAEKQKYGNSKFVVIQNFEHGDHRFG